MGTVELHKGDCLEVLRSIKTHSVDVGVTSPPYNLGGDFHSSSVNDKIRRSYGGYEDDDDNLPEDVYQKNQIDVLNELHRVIKPSGWLFYSHKNRIKNGSIISPLSWIASTPWIVYQDVVIDMNGTTNVDKRRFFPSHEFVFVLSARSGNKLHNDHCVTSIWKFPQVNRYEVGHPASFHIGLPTICLEASAHAGQTAIDPYMGRGTTGIAAMRLGMNFIGIERKAGFFELAQNNLAPSNNRLQPTCQAADVEPESLQQSLWPVARG